MLFPPLIIDINIHEVQMLSLISDLTNILILYTPNSFIFYALFKAR